MHLFINKNFGTFLCDDSQDDVKSKNVNVDEISNKKDDNVNNIVDIITAHNCISNVKKIVLIAFI